MVVDTSAHFMLCLMLCMQHCIKLLYTHLTDALAYGADFWKKLGCVTNSYDYFHMQTVQHCFETLAPEWCMCPLLAAFHLQGACLNLITN